MASPLQKIIREVKRPFYSAKKWTIKKIYGLIRESYAKNFPSTTGNWLEPSMLSSENILTGFPELQKLDRHLNYFLLHASFGDKWFILSLIPAHFSLYPSSRVIASSGDRGIIELFLGEKVAREKVVFIDDIALTRISSVFRPTSRISTQIIDSWSAPGCQHTVTPYLIKNGLPPGTIRHLHICYYPYFNELFNIHAVGYIPLLKTLLYLPFEAKPTQPAYYHESDYRKLNQIIGLNCAPTQEAQSPFILFNAVNFSHQPLTKRQISLTLEQLELAGFRVLINSAQGKFVGDLSALAHDHKKAVVVDIPPRILALVCGRAAAVIGVLGGAMSIAAQFSNAHILSFQTNAVGTGCDDQRLYADKGKANLWHWADQDWPCLCPGRVMENRFIEDSHSFSEKDFTASVHSFVEKIKI